MFLFQLLEQAFRNIFNAVTIKCRVIGKNGETIKALQQFTGAQIQIDQRSDPTRVSIAGAPKAMQMATSMVQVEPIYL